MEGNARRFLWRGHLIRQGAHYLLDEPTSAMDHTSEEG